MTTPAPPQQANVLQDAAEAAFITDVLITAITPAAALAAVALRFRLQGLALQAWGSALSISMDMPAALTGISGPGSAQMTRLNTARRAQFTITAASRITAALADARAHNRPLQPALAKAVKQERRYFAQHLVAVWGREHAAAQVDSAWMSYGPVLGWYTVLDRNTSAGCRAANGKNFLAAAMPAIGFPGTVHPHCRCYPGAPHPGGRMLATRQIARAA